MGNPRPPPPPARAEYAVADGERVCLLPRLALSELIVLCGLVRGLCARAADVMLLAKRDHVRSIRNLYGDLPGVRFKLVDSWEALYTPANAAGETVLEEMARLGYRVIPLPSFREACPYRLLGVDPAARQHEFRLRRGLPEEGALHDRVVAAAGGTYVVVHDDEARPIRRELLPRGYAVVSVRDPRFRTPNAFDWVRVIDGAVQFHGVDSCFMLLAEFLALRPRKYLHAYASGGGAPQCCVYRDVVTIW
jgi:hypothetical protein